MVSRHAKPATWRPRGRASYRPAVVLVDAIVGTIILAIVLAVILSLASRALATQGDARRLQIVAMLLDEQLALVLARGPDDYRRSFPTRGACDAPFQDYAFELEFEGGAAGDPYLVRATIRWLEGSRPRAESCETLIAPRLGDDPDPVRTPPEAETRPA